MAVAPVLETIVSYYVETKLLRNLPSIFTGCLNVKLVLTFFNFFAIKMKQKWTMSFSKLRKVGKWQITSLTRHLQLMV